MENLARKLLLKIVEQIKPHLTNTLHGPFFLKHENLWRIVIESSNPGSGSLTFDILQKHNDSNSNLTFLFYSSVEHRRLKVIFEKIKKLCCDLSLDVFTSECFITFNRKINFGNQQETEEFLAKTCVFFQKFFVIIRGLKFNKIRAYNHKAFILPKPKIIMKSKRYLIRLRKPAILPLNKSYYYL
jgi:hypothetical protein